MTSDPDSSADTFAAERSYEVGDTIGDSDTAHGGPEPHQLEPLA